MKDDTISRRAALDALGERPMIWTDKIYYILGARNQYDKDRLAIETVPSAQPEQRWIPCSKQMPEEFGYYLCWYEYYHVSKNKVLPEYGIGYYDPEMEFWSGEVRQGRGAKVLAWTFLPEPWEGEPNE